MVVDTELRNGPEEPVESPREAQEGPSAKERLDESIGRFKERQEGALKSELLSLAEIVQDKYGLGEDKEGISKFVEKTRSVISGLMNKRVGRLKIPGFIADSKIGKFLGLQDREITYGDIATGLIAGVTSAKTRALIFGSTGPVGWAGAGASVVFGGVLGGIRGGLRANRAFSEQAYSGQNWRERIDLIQDPVAKMHTIAVLLGEPDAKKFFKANPDQAVDLLILFEQTAGKSEQNELMEKYSQTEQGFEIANQYVTENEETRRTAVWQGVKRGAVVGAAFGLFGYGAARTFEWLHGLASEHGLQIGHADTAHPNAAHGTGENPAGGAASPDAHPAAAATPDHHQFDYRTSAEPGHHLQIDPKSGHFVEGADQNAVVHVDDRGLINGDQSGATPLEVAHQVGESLKHDGLINPAEQANFEKHLSDWLTEHDSQNMIHSDGGESLYSSGAEVRIPASAINQSLGETQFNPQGIEHFQGEPTGAEQPPPPAENPAPQAPGQESGAEGLGKSPGDTVPLGENSAQGAGHAGTVIKDELGTRVPLDSNGNTATGDGFLTKIFKEIGKVPAGEKALYSAGTVALGALAIGAIAKVRGDRSRAAERRNQENRTANLLEGEYEQTDIRQIVADILAINEFYKEQNLTEREQEAIDTRIGETMYPRLAEAIKECSPSDHLLEKAASYGLSGEDWILDDEYKVFITDSGNAVVKLIHPSGANMVVALADLPNYFSQEQENESFYEDEAPVTRPAIAPEPTEEFRERLIDGKSPAEILDGIRQDILNNQNSTAKNKLIALAEELHGTLKLECLLDGEPASINSVILAHPPAVIDNYRIALRQNGEPVGPLSLNEFFGRTSEWKEINPTEQTERVPYVSWGAIVKRLHELGGSRREIIPKEILDRIYELQELVSGPISGWDKSITTEEWNELAELKTRGKEMLQHWIDQKEAEAQPPKSENLKPSELIDRFRNLAKKENRSEAEELELLNTQMNIADRKIQIMVNAETRNDQEAVKAAKEDGADLEKPFTIEELAENHVTLRQGDNTWTDEIDWKTEDIFEDYELVSDETPTPSTQEPTIPPTEEPIIPPNAEPPIEQPPAAEELEGNISRDEAISRIFSGTNPDEVNLNLQSLGLLETDLNCSHDRGIVAMAGLRGLDPARLRLRAGAIGEGKLVFHEEGKSGSFPATDDELREVLPEKLSYKEPIPAPEPPAAPEAEQTELTDEELLDQTKSETLAELGFSEKRLVERFELNKTIEDLVNRGKKAIVFDPISKKAKIYLCSLKNIIPTDLEQPDLIESPLNSKNEKQVMFIAEDEDIDSSRPLSSIREKALEQYREEHGANTEMREIKTQEELDQLGQDDYRIIGIARLAYNKVTLDRVWQTIPGEARVGEFILITKEQEKPEKSPLDALFGSFEERTQPLPEYKPADDRAETIKSALLRRSTEYSETPKKDYSDILKYLEGALAEGKAIEVGRPHYYITGVSNFMDEVGFETKSNPQSEPRHRSLKNALNDLDWRFVNIDKDGNFVAEETTEKETATAKEEEIPAKQEEQRELILQGNIIEKKAKDKIIIPEGKGWKVDRVVHSTIRLEPGSMLEVNDLERSTITLKANAKIKINGVRRKNKFFRSPGAEIIYNGESSDEIEDVDQ